VNILFATPEIAPWVKTGGLGDVAGALPLALRATGSDVRVLVPRYPALREAFPEAAHLAHIPWMGGHLPGADIYAAYSAAGLPLLLLDCPPLFDRPGNPYLAPGGQDWPDNYLRFGLLSRVAARLASHASPLAWRADILHCQDWQSALAPYYLRFHERGVAKTILTIHNLAFQGAFPPDVLGKLALGPRDWHIDGVEYYGRISFLKAGLRHADALTTVSPTYAREIQSDVEGRGMQGLLKARAADLTGILNGIDPQDWNPATDVHLVTRYDRDNLAAKLDNKAALQREVGLAARSDCPLFGIVSRLTEQKGLDLVAAIGDALVELPAQLVVLGSGSHALESAYRLLAARHPQQVAVTIGFDEGLAHRIEAGADIFLMPSRFEPCGLNQMYSLTYGTLPLVRATGGLADTVVNYSEPALKDGRANGFVCSAADAQSILDTASEAALLWRDPRRWRRLQRNAMAGDYSWTVPARRYRELYARLMEK
jgi:starch synthase